MKNKFLLSASGFALCMSVMTLSSSAAYAQQEMGSLTYYDVPASEIQEHYNEWRVYLEYNLHREQCQHYQAPPPGYVERGCNVYRVGSVAETTNTSTSTQTATQTVTQTTAATTAATPAPASPAAAPVDYTINFGVDRSRVPANEKSTVNKAAQEIQKDNPSTVIVSGYTSTTGSAEHNQALSERRAQAVTDTLVTDGVNAAIITQKAYGETHLAVPTGDNVEMPANRRAVIEFNQ